jgi:hypothetical protein
MILIVERYGSATVKTLINTLVLTTAVVAGLLFGGTTQAQGEFPKTSKEGMVLVPDSNAQVAYAMPGASLEQYKRINLLDCYVAFRENYRRDINKTRPIGARVTENDMEIIKKELAEEFRTTFTNELQNTGGDELVAVGGEDVLTVRPAIVNLYVVSPDTQQGAVSSAGENAGEMTLIMELYDSSGSIIARVMDAQVADRGGFAVQANRTTNKVETTRILRRWAGLLLEHMGRSQ